MIQKHFVNSFVKFYMTFSVTFSIISAFADVNVIFYALSEF